MSIKLVKTSALLSAAALIGTLSSAAILGGAAAQTPHQHGTVHAAKRHHHPRRHRAHSGIPQHNGGDHDSDNRGGPSDGDGNV